MASAVNRLFKEHPDDQKRADRDQRKIGDRDFEGPEWTTAACEAPERRRNRRPENRLSAGKPKCEAAEDREHSERHDERLDSNVGHEKAVQKSALEPDRERGWNRDPWRAAPDEDKRSATQALRPLGAIEIGR
jgi:hypothetical protein